MFAGPIFQPIQRALRGNHVPKMFSLENWGNDYVADRKGETRGGPSLGEQSMAEDLVDVSG